MSHLAATSIDPSHNDVSDLLDVLYEILASGLEPESATVSSSDIETFLHQHARSPKSRADMEAFFRQGGLPMQLDNFVRDSGLRLAAVSVPTPSTGGEVHAPDPTGRHPVTISTVAPRPVPANVSQAVAPVRAASEASSVTRLWFAFGVLCVALLTALVFGGLSLMSLRDQVAKTDANQRQLLTALSTLKDRTEHVDTRLNDQAKVIGESHQQLDRLVESFLPLDAK